MSRRHKLASEASYRFERGVDRELPVRASARAVSLLASLGGATVVPGCSHAAVDVPPVTIGLPAGFPGQVAGQSYAASTVIARLRDVGCQVSPAGAGQAGQPAGDAAGAGAYGRGAGADGGGQQLTVVPPSWRTDLLTPIDLAEEVIRLEGYDNVPVRMPHASAGRGLTAQQRLRRVIGRGLAGAGYVEVLSHPFAAAADHDRLQLPPGDPRRAAPRLANPLSEDEPFLRTTLLPGLLRVLARNAGRGFSSLALYEVGTVFRLRPGGPGRAPILRVDTGPSAEEIALLETALPDQPLRVAAVLAGDRDAAGWWGPGRPAGWQDAIEAARLVLRHSGVPFRVQAGRREPWHPGRCAALLVTGADGQEHLAGHAGELHPRAVEAFRLPARACAMELSLAVIEREAAALGPVQAPKISAYPVATQDVALVVPREVPASEVEAALVAGAAGVGGADGGSLLEEVRLFDVYTGQQAGEGHKSLAYTLRFRAPGRTLTDDETSAARDAAVAEAARRVGAVPRGAAGA
jgi:phenylalanyl-tRNA synthetase beta chain